ncbi:MAG: non-hydrolyzing UDP-N-acetylglucosamine 2-epimerase [Gammaproteobacteria bacterium]
MLKVATIVGTRPELIKLSRVIAELDKQFDHVLVHTGQNYNYELNEIFFDELEIKKPKHFLNVAENSSSETIGKVIIQAHKVLQEERPDAVLIYGDTNSCLSAIAAKRLKIPVFHMEAGNRCFDERVPEEINRRIIDHISDINMPLTEHARQYLLKEGIKPETIIKTGSTMKEALAYYSNKISNSDILKNLNLSSQQYFLVSAHREENVDCADRLKSLLQALKELTDKYNIPILFSTHPRTKKRLEEMGVVEGTSSISFVKAFGFLDYIELQKNAYCIISDSGTIAEEASILNLPAITIRQAHERPEGMDQGVLVMSDIKSDRIIDAVAMVKSQHNWDVRSNKIVSDYDEDKVSEKVARIILSYTDYVKRTVWHQQI